MEFKLIGYNWGLVEAERSYKTFKALKKAFFNACYYGVYEEIDLLINDRLKTTCSADDPKACKFYRMLYRQAVKTDFIEYA